MGHVVHMLEVDDFPYRDVSQIFIIQSNVTKRPSNLFCFPVFFSACVRRVILLVTQL